MANRNAQLAIESLITESVYAHVGQVVVEALVNHPTASPTTPTGAGVSQVVVEALIVSSEATRVSQVVVEALIRDGDVEPEGGTGGGTHAYGWAG